MVSIDTGHRSPERFGVPRAARGRSGPGGLLVIEDYDNALPVTAYPPHPDAERVVGAQRVTDAVLDLMSSMGHDGECGRKLPSELEALGLEDVRAEGRVRLIGSGTPDTAFFSLSMETLREALVSSGRARDEEIQERLADLAEPGRTFLSPILVACHGRRALSEQEHRSGAIG